MGDEFEDFKKGEVEASCKVGEGLLNYQVVQFMAFGPQTSFRRTPSDPNMFSRFSIAVCIKAYGR